MRMGLKACNVKTSCGNVRNWLQELDEDDDEEDDKDGNEDDDDGDGVVERDAIKRMAAKMAARAAKVRAEAAAAGQ